MSCRICGKSEALLYRCKYCGGYFCPDHRLPENHSCPELWLAKPPVERWSRVKKEKKIEYLPVKRGWFIRTPLSSTEVKHFTLASLLVLLVGLSLAGWRSDLQILLGTAIIFLASFMLHELAHRISARIRGLWAEFRLETYGALLTAISIVSPLKIIAPGAVFIVGSAGSDVIGKVALSGPLTNLILVGVFYFASVFTPPGLFWVTLVLKYGVYVNAVIAVFNLLPFSALDGLKVLMWSRRMWVSVFVPSLVILAANISGVLP
jgi:Zn-dependent protease